MVSLTARIYGVGRNHVERLVKERGVVISIYGLGYIGLASVAAYTSKGFRVVGYDPSRERVSQIENGSIKHPDPVVRDIVSRAYREGLLEIVEDGVEASRRGDVKLVDVPLSWGSRGPVFRYLDSAVESISMGLSRGDIVVIETTTPPGVTGSRVRRILEEGSGLVCGRDFGLSYSPMRISVERAYEDLVRKYPKIVGGVDRDSPEILSILFKEVYEAGFIIMSSSTAAEFEKIAEGIYRDANIAIANELARAARELGIDIWEVIMVSRTNPYISIHNPGSGVGGVSLPYQPYLLAWSIARRWIWDSTIIRARRANEEQPGYIAGLLMEGLGIIGVNPEEARVAILGLAYKGDVSDHRNSPTYGIAGHLVRRGVTRIAIHDPYVKEQIYGVKTTADLEEALRGASGVVISTDHSLYRRLAIEEITRISGEKRIAIVDARRIIDTSKKNRFGDIKCIYTTPGTPWVEC